MTIPRRSWRVAGTFAAATVAGLTGAILCAGPAAAHTPTWAVTCTDVNLDLTAYNGGVTNQVTVTVDGKDLLPTQTFGNEFHKKLELPQHDKELTVHLVVKAGDGDRYSKDETKTAPVCEDTPKPTPTVTESTPAAEPSEDAPAPSASPSESSPESAPAAASPSPSSPDLAETGSSSATPVIGGAAVAVLLAGGGIMWSVRKRRTAQN
ncbi:LAETG motif-containing sortase-dependent surface protein [Streptomyces sp. NBC_00316]|uniref:LAETG motif-containing sortase-dependent surface protein n=1 Tax=Streptomyces sp. NBC_00316 TaxID=2975710 RepID=UPI002E2DA8AF|nr:LAETG motif-containing sortase-dependent surface protein [Streptomyces sp. NBC_00316]